MLFVLDEWVPVDVLGRVQTVAVVMVVKQVVVQPDLPGYRSPERRHLPRLNGGVKRDREKTHGGVNDRFWWC